MQRVVIFSGGQLGEWALAEIQEHDLIIGADRGAWFLLEHDIRPDIALGDFDSVNAGQLGIIREKSGQFFACDPVMKDLTDTEMAFDTALKLRPAPSEIVLCGAIGTRFDHTLANVHLLRRAVEQGIPCRICGEKNEIRLIDSRTVIRKSRFTHVSLLPFTLTVAGINLQGFQYPLVDATLQIGQSLGISNMITADEGEITISSGLLLVIQSSD
ncbi:MAG TPA: thiamine diphosphokinase [Bacilli bacterium]